MRKANRICAPILSFALLIHAAFAQAEDQPARLLETAGVQGGLVVVLNNAHITAEIRSNDRFLVQGLFQDEKSRASAREKMQAKGGYGPVTVKAWGGEKLPYLDNMVNLIIAEDAGSLSPQEILRVLAPGGVVLSKKDLKLPGSAAAAGWHKAVKAWPDNIDEWTHWMHGPDNNAVSKDTYKEIPRGLQWIEPPRWWKSHELAPPFSAMVTAKGRLFYIADESLLGIARMPDRWHLTARDAFNGSELWKLPIKEWGGTYWKDGYIDSGGARLKNPDQVLRRLVAVEDKVFVTLGLFAPVSMLDAATGQTLKTFAGTENTFEIIAEKGRLYLAANAELKKKGGVPDISLMAVDVESGKLLWQQKGYQGIWQTKSLAPQFVDAGLTLGKEGLFFINKQDIVALDLNTGEKKWTAKRYDYSGGKNRKDAAPSYACLTYHDSILFYSQKGDTAPLVALAADSGKQLWAKKADSIACNTSPDIFVNHGLVWILNTAGTWTYEGLDLLTGERKKTLDMSLINSGTHHNCYKNKATQDFFLYGRNKGVEFFDIDHNSSKRINWAKGACRYGILPANGMIYFPSHFCTCYAAAKLNGMAAVARTGITTAEPSTAAQVSQGPAYGRAFGAEAGGKDWPTYRQNNARTGFQPAPLSDAMQLKWTAYVGGRLTPPIMAEQKVFLASKDDHRVVCLEAATGKIKWTFLADGRVDSPPSFYKGRLVFGGSDGSVYCLDADSGELAWRFRAAPTDQQMGAFGQLESVWPVFGTLVVQDDQVFCTAGRNANVNQGLYLYKLDLKTGSPVAALHHMGDLKENGEIDTGVNADILVSDGSKLHLRGMVFDMKSLKMTDKGLGAARVLDTEARMDLNLIVALGGFLDDSFFNGSFWAYNQTKANILGLDREHLYGVNIYASTRHKSSAHVNFYPGEQGIKLFSAKLKSTVAEENLTKKQRKKEKQGGDLWSATLPIEAKSLVVGADRLYLAGTRDKVDKEDPWAHFDGRKGGLLTIHAKKDGQMTREIELKSPPVFDGLAAADKRLFISCQDGTVLCFE